jgi:serine/threonine protein kinase
MIGSKEFAGLAARKRPQAEDTGPYFIGKIVGEIYEIRRVLGWGGMGIVYGALDTARHREVAVKVPLGKFVDDPDARKRFAREAKSWIRLVHPNIVHAFDVRDDWTTDSRPAIFMDYCDGGSLAERLRQDIPLSLPDAMHIAIQVC